jgi:hypothetical protein
VAAISAAASLPASITSTISFDRPFLLRSSNARTIRSAFECDPDREAYSVPLRAAFEIGLVQVEPATAW